MNKLFPIVIALIIILNIYSMFKLMAIAMDKDKIEEVENKFNNLNLFGRILLGIYLILILPLIIIIWLAYIIGLMIDGIKKLLNIICFKRK